MNMDDIQWTRQHDENDIIFSEDNLTLKRLSDKPPLIIYANKRIPVSSAFYFEIEVLECLNAVAIGVTPLYPADETKIGWPTNASYTYHGDTGKIWHNRISTSLGPSLSKKDILGCGYDREGTLFFTINGEKYETSFSLQGVPEVYPIVAFRGEGAKIKANFGTQPFVGHPNYRNFKDYTIIKTFYDEWMSQFESSTSQNNYSGFDHLSDVKIISKDGEAIRAHRLVLSVRSGVFKALFEKVDQDNAIIHIKEFNNITVKKMIHFIYTDSLPAHTEIDMDLLAIANMYDIKSLQLVCEIGLCKELLIENSVEAWIGADLLQCKKLMDFSEKFITKNWLEIQKSDSFRKLMKESPEKIAELSIKLLNLEYEKGSNKNMNIIN